jgi:predicted ATPase
MIEWVHYHNFGILKDARLPLGRFTIIVGPNSSGKTTALAGLAAAALPNPVSRESVQTIGESGDPEILIKWGESQSGATSTICWKKPPAAVSRVDKPRDGGKVDQAAIKRELETIRIFQFDADAIAKPSPLREKIATGRTGEGLVGDLDRLRDIAPERFTQLNAQLSRWFPEFDSIMFDVQGGAKKLKLRIRGSNEAVPANKLSEGTRMGLALLTLTCLPEPPMLIGIEEPERGMHPRLLKNVHDALYRLCFPESFGDERGPVQVVVTTHSPYFLDLFKDNIEEVVIAERQGATAGFRRVSEIPEIKDELSAGAPLGDIWFSGVLGGVPEER